MSNCGKAYLDEGVSSVATVFGLILFLADDFLWLLDVLRLFGSAWSVPSLEFPLIGGHE